MGGGLLQVFSQGSQLQNTSMDTSGHGGGAQFNLGMLSLEASGWFLCHLLAFYPFLFQVSTILPNLRHISAENMPHS